MGAVKMVKSDQILVKMTLFADGLDVRYERKHRVKDDPEVWGQSTWEVFLLKWRKKQALKVEIRSLGWNLSTLGCLLLIHMELLGGKEAGFTEDALAGMI